MKGPTHRQIGAFLEVCRDFHFSQAARRLGMAQPQLSRTVRELEAYIGTKLFARQGRKVSLSPAGEVFLREVFQLPAILGRAVEGARRAAAGEESVLRLGFVGALMGEELLEVFERYRSQHPDTQLSLFDLPPSDLLRQVESAELDGAFLGVKPKELPKGLSSFQWKEEPVLACLPREHRLANRKRIKVADLQDETVVVLAASLAPSYRDFLDELLETEGGRNGPYLETNGADAILSMVVAGCGVALLPRSALRKAEGRLVAVPLAGTQARLREVFLYRSGESRVVSPLLELLRG
ncbi:LysR family transcriptional regulator [Pelagicoccus sp. NFK12]|uniref:LysR family transcriptional regulator n=1 Tax=Pelagicoccus enzymogenes TaxID=2773457 RepID=A0A927FCP4_9BACT|nr:LysR substrate-binding domain-containing protein [Pelagicoccus enzymogenes]MBD5781969.1 LysR family transcriptional regulator [Pelagicoccus enzymogenes]